MYPENFDNNQNITVIDNYTNQFYSLQPGANAIDFTVDTSIPASVDSYRFTLLFENDTLSVDDNELTENQIIVYPNPVDNLLYVNNTLESNFDIEIYNATGQLIKITTLNQLQNQSIDLTGQAAGIYLIKFSDSSRSIFKKVVKK